MNDLKKMCAIGTFVSLSLIINPNLPTLVLYSISENYKNIIPEKSSNQKMLNPRNYLTSRHEIHKIKKLISFFSVKFIEKKGFTCDFIIYTCV